MGPVHGRKLTPAAMRCHAGQDAPVDVQTVEERQHRGNGDQERDRARAVEMDQQRQQRGAHDDARRARANDAQDADR